MIDFDKALDFLNGTELKLMAIYDAVFWYVRGNNIKYNSTKYVIFIKLTYDATFKQFTNHSKIIHE